MLSWLQPFLEGGRLVIHVMDSLDSLASAAECKSHLAVEAERWHRLHGKVNTGFELEQRHWSCGDGGSTGGCGEQQRCHTLFPPITMPSSTQSCPRPAPRVGTGRSRLPAGSEAQPCSTCAGVICMGFVVPV